MNITNNDFKTIKKAIDLLSRDHKDDLKAIPAEDRKTIIEANDVLSALLEKKERDNKRISKYIADKRKINPLYARTPYIKKDAKKTIDEKEETI